MCMRMCMCMCMRLSPHAHSCPRCAAALSQDHKPRAQTTHTGSRGRTDRQRLTSQTCNATCNAKTCRRPLRCSADCATCAHLPTSPHISPYLPISPQVQCSLRDLRTSPHISPYLPISPHISPHLLRCSAYCAICARGHARASRDRAQAWCSSLRQPRHCLVGEHREWAIQ